MEKNTEKTDYPRLVTELPGPAAKAVLAKDNRFISPSYTRAYPLVIKKGQGVIVTDIDGNRFLDFTSGIAVCNTGHSHPKVVEAITDQAHKFLHMSGTDFYYSAQSKLAEKLVSLAPENDDWRVFYSNSGAESIEAALKLVRYHTRRTRIISFFGAFHGRTMGAMSLSASKSIHEKGVNEKFLSVIGIAAALIDYRLPKGGAKLFWRDLQKIATSIQISSLTDIRRVFNIFLKTKSTIIQNSQKRKRIQKFFDKVSKKILTDFENYRENPNVLWNELAYCFNTKPQRKTIAFAMKVFDLVSLLCRNRYLKFSEMWIPVDFHIRELTKLFGLVDNSARDEEILKCWEDVSKEVEKMVNRGINLFRIDSVLWQIGVLLYNRKVRKHVWDKEKVLKYMIKIGVNKNNASKFVNEVDSISLMLSPYR